jgi:hypothetical protein
METFEFMVFQHSLGFIILYLSFYYMYLQLNLMACLDLLWLRIFLLQQQCVSCSTHDLDLIPMHFSLLFLLLNVNQFVLLLW